MNRPLSRLTFLYLLLGLVALAFAGNYLSIGFARVLYPYDLDFIEDAIFMQAWRVAQNSAGLPTAKRRLCASSVHAPIHLAGWLAA